MSLKQNFDPYVSRPALTHSYNYKMDDGGASALMPIPYESPLNHFCYCCAWGISADAGWLLYFHHILLWQD